jgi:hypothetical protein
MVFCLMVFCFATESCWVFPKSADRRHQSDRKDDLRSLVAARKESRVTSENKTQKKYRRKRNSMLCKIGQKYNMIHMFELLCFENTKQTSHQSKDSSFSIFGRLENWNNLVRSSLYALFVSGFVGVLRRCQ